MPSVSVSVAAVMAVIVPPAVVAVTAIAYRLDVIDRLVHRRWTNIDRNLHTVHHGAATLNVLVGDIAGRQVVSDHCAGGDTSNRCDDPAATSTDLITQHAAKHAAQDRAAVAATSHGDTLDMALLPSLFDDAVFLSGRCHWQGEDGE